MVSKEFSTLTDLNKHYDLIRKDILIRHNVKEGTRVRLKNAIMLQENFNGQWVNMTSIKTDMIDRIKTYNNFKKESIFRLKVLV